MPIVENYLIYLRKSRADAEAEQRGEGETLARHGKTLEDLARRLGLHVGDVYRELASGETIAARPQMQRLLREVEEGLWAGVLVMEVERLARGDTIDQGVVARAFRFSGAKIITPAKIYDPENEFDEEYFEFGLFMSRREYKSINRRLQRGREASLREGKYPHSVAPYGYYREKLQHDKGFTIVPDSEEAPVVRMIFRLYTGAESGERIGLYKIAARLNRLDIPTRRGKRWTEAGVRDILLNPVYIGKLRKNKRRAEKVRRDGVMTVRYLRRGSAQECCDGIHQPLIDEETYRLALSYLRSTPALPLREGTETENPLCGLVVCGKCGRKMQRRKHFKKDGGAGLACPNPACGNVGAALSLVEDRVRSALAAWLGDRTLPQDAGSGDGESCREAVRRLEAAMERLKSQDLRVHELLEQGVYDPETFTSRRRTIAEQLEEKAADLAAARVHLAEQAEISRFPFAPESGSILDIYDSLPTNSAKNTMLQLIIDRIIYVKEIENRHCREDGFTIDLYPNIH